MKTFTKIWDLIIHSEEVDKKLRSHLVERVERIISRYDPVELNKNFDELSENIGNMVAEPFRKKAIQLLNGQYNSHWELSRAEAIFHLLNSSRLRWTKAEYLTVLENMSNLIDYK